MEQAAQESSAIFLGGFSSIITCLGLFRNSTSYIRAWQTGLDQGIQLVAYGPPLTFLLSHHSPPLLFWLQQQLGDSGICLPLAVTPKSRQASRTLPHSMGSRERVLGNMDTLCSSTDRSVHMHDLKAHCSSWCGVQPPAT